MKYPTTLILDSERCVMRYISKEDIPHIYRAAQYPGFTDGMLWEPPETEGELLPQFEKNVKAWREDRAYCFTIETRDPVAFAGRIAIRSKEEKGVWDLGFWTHPEKQGNGFMTEAVESVIRFGFRALGATEIVACHALWNRASERVLKKNGMRLIRHIPEGFKKRGAWVEENLLGIDFETWKAKQVE